MFTGGHHLKNKHSHIMMDNVHKSSKRPNTKKLCTGKHFIAQRKVRRFHDGSDCDQAKLAADY